MLPEKQTKSRDETPRECMCDKEPVKRRLDLPVEDLPRRWAVTLTAFIRRKMSTIPSNSSRPAKDHKGPEVPPPGRANNCLNQRQQDLHCFLEVNQRRPKRKNSTIYGWCRKVKPFSIRASACFHFFIHHFILLQFWLFLPGMWRSHPSL